MRLSQGVLREIIAEGVMLAELGVLDQFELGTKLFLRLDNRCL